VERANRAVTLQPFVERTRGGERRFVVPRGNAVRGVVDSVELFEPTGHGLGRTDLPRRQTDGKCSNSSCLGHLHGAIMPVRWKAATTDTPRMELHPTSESWRTALITACGAFVIGLAAVLAALATDDLFVLWLLVGVAAFATLVPAIGLMTASVDADRKGVTVRRFGFSKHYAWTDVDAVTVIARRAQVPDGTEYHWTGISTHKHVVAVPTLELADGRAVQLTALASPVTTTAATPPTTRPADEHAAALESLRVAERQPA
jgi:hypothetical protein